jgi:hypothetical protein
VSPPEEPKPGRAASAIVEIVRFEVEPERREELVAGHLDARRAIRAVSPPGALWSRLAQLDERRWVEVVAWGSRSVFEQAVERSQDDPTARGWFDLSEPGYTIAIGELAGDPGSPPREGELELVWGAGTGKGTAEHMTADTWRALAEIDGRTFVDPSGWVESEPTVVRLAVRRRVDPQAESSDLPEGEPSGDAGRIVDAIDAAEEQDPSA